MIGEMNSEIKEIDNNKKYSFYHLLIIRGKRTVRSQAH